MPVSCARYNVVYAAEVTAETSTLEALDNYDLDIDADNDMVTHFEVSEEAIPADEIEEIEHNNVQYTHTPFWCGKF